MLIENIFISLIKNSDYFRIVFPFLKEEYFQERDERLLFRKISKHYMLHNKIPTIADLRLVVESDYDISLKDTEAINEKLNSLKKAEVIEDVELLVTETEKWVKNRAIEKATQEFVDSLEKDDGSRGQKIEEIKAALGIEFVVNLGHDYFDKKSLKERLASYSEEDTKIPLDIENINKALGGGLVKKSIACILGSTNTGKCLSYDTEVLMADGTYKTIEYLYHNRDNDTIITMTNEHKLIPTKILDWYDSGVIDTYKLTTNDGITTVPSSTHPYYTLDGWKQVTDLKIGDKIAIAKKYKMFDDIDNGLQKDDAVLIGLMLSDGSITSSVGFSNKDKELLNLFQNICKKCDNRFKFRYSGNTLYAGIGIGIKNPIKTKLKQYNIFGKNSHDKTIPDVIFTSSLDNIASFLGAFYACDGHISNRNGRTRIELSLCNKKMITQIRSLLLRFDIKPRITQSYSILNGKRFEKFSINIGDVESIRKFRDKIKIPLSYKQENLDRIADMVLKTRGQYNQFPKELWQNIKSLAKEKGISISQLELMTSTEVKLVKRSDQKNGFRKSGRTFRTDCDISFETLSSINIILKDHFIQSLLDGDIYFDKIKSLEYNGKIQCYDLTIPDTHNFIANDVVVHNTTWLVHMAASLIRSGKNVGILSGEMSVKEYHSRIDANILDIPINKLNHTLDKSVYKSKFKTIMEQTHGELLIKYFRAGSMNALHIRNWLQEVKLKKGFIPDVLILDHLTLFSSTRLPASRTGEHIYVTCVVEEIRDIAVEFDCCILTGVQLNRGAKAKKQDISNEDVGLGYGISQVSDVSLGLVLTAELREQNKYLCRVLKTRFGSNNEQLYGVGVCFENMKLLNLDESEEVVPLHIRDKIKVQQEKADRQEEKLLFDFN